MGGAQAPLNPLEAVGERHALLVHVIDRRPIPGGFAATGEGQVVVVRDRGAGDSAVPIRVGAAQLAEVRGWQAVKFARYRVLEGGGVRT